MSEAALFRRGACYNFTVMDQVRNNYTAIIEKDVATGLYVAYIPDLPGAHTQGETLEELNKNLKEVVALVLEDGDDQQPESYFVGTQLVGV